MGTKGLKFPDRFGSASTRFEERYIPEPSSGCWIWLGHLSGSSGYGYLDVDGRSERAHRYSYTMHKGVIPNGLVIDHLCRMPWCVNPDHLEAVTQKTNVQRGNVTGNHKLYCHQGHPKFGENLYINPAGFKVCRECVRISVRKYQQKKISQ